MVAAEPVAWRQPEVERAYQRWMSDHFGELDMELLCTAMYNAGARQAVFSMKAFSGIQADISRAESRIVGLRQLWDSIVQEDA